MSYTANQVYSVLGQIQDNRNDGGYQIQIRNNYQQLIDTVKKENATLNSTYSNGWALNSAAGQQSKYIYQSSSILAKIYNYGFWIYMLVALILCIIIGVKPYNIYFKALLILAILLYPFYIYPLEEFCYIISVYIWDLLLSTTYDNGYANTSLEYGLSGSAGSFGSNQGGSNQGTSDSNQQGSSQDDGGPYDNGDEDNAAALGGPVPGATDSTSLLPTFSFESNPGDLTYITPGPTSTNGPMPIQTPSSQVVINNYIGANPSSTPSSTPVATTVVAS